jgi:hypothetical protein
MSKKIYDLCAKTGSYTDSQGNEKGKYENVGSVMMNDDQSKFIFIKKTFNPAGVPGKDGSDSILISMFEPKQQN